MATKLRLTLVLAALTIGGVARADDTWVMSDSNAKATHDCGKQPVVVVNASVDEVALTGACTKVSVNGARVKVTAASIDQLVVNGAENVITVDAVAKIAVTGAANKVVWKAAIGGKRPHVSDLGSGDNIAAAPAAAPPSK